MQGVHPESPGYVNRPAAPVVPPEYYGHRGSCRIFYAERRCTCGGPAGPVVQGAEQPAPDSTAGGALREAKQLWHDLINEDDQGAVDKLAQLLADAAELRATVQRVEALAEKLDTDITKCRTYAAQAQAEFDLASEASYAMQAANLDAVSTRLYAALNGEKP
jgi:hypothetical protein